jgi:hypothetical protein
MITAIVRYKLPATIGKNECLAHFHKIAPGFAKEKGFIRKQFIWSENGIAGGVYQWETLADLAIGLAVYGLSMLAAVGGGAWFAPPKPRFARLNVRLTPKSRHVRCS